MFLSGALPLTHPQVDLCAEPPWDLPRLIKELGLIDF